MAVKKRLATSPMPNKQNRTASQEQALNDLQQTISEAITPEQEEMQRMNAVIPKRLHYALKKEALETDSSITNILIGMLEERYKGK